VHPLTAARTRAYLEDCVRYLGLAAVLVPIGLVVQRRGTPSRAAVLGLSLRGGREAQLGVWLGDAGNEAQDPDQDEDHTDAQGTLLDLGPNVSRGGGLGA